MTEAISTDTPDSLLIREIATQSHDEVSLVAERMQATLIEIEGAHNAARLHSPQWIRDRLLWHIDNPEVLGKAMVAVLGTGEIIGHTLLRRETDPTGRDYGLFSTTYVVPRYRRQGIASRLLLAGEEWFRHFGLNRFSTWTSATNTKLIHLYEKHNYQVISSGRNEVTGTLMVHLSKVLPPPDGAA